MSVSKWAYTPEKCDGDFCIGDCDNCSKKDETSITELINDLRTASKAAEMSHHPTWAHLMTEAAWALEMSQYTDQAQDDFIQELLAEREWIPVTERLPEKYKRVLTVDSRDNSVSENFLISAERNEWSFPSYTVSHWMCLPDPPKEET